MDAFYASVEQRDFPEYQGKPLIVGGSPEGRGGVVATASYEARKFGIRSAMPSRTALRLCPDAIFVFPRFEAYKAVSRELREILHRYTDIVEPLSLDEAYLDVTKDKKGMGYALDIAKEIKQAICDELRLTASAGVSINKFLAKVASDMNKPNGITFIGPSRIESFMESLPVEKFFGVGKVTAEKMRTLGLFNGADLKTLTEPELVRYFGKIGHFYYNIVRGVDNRPVQPFRETKSVSVEDTYPEDLETRHDITVALEDLVEKLVIRLNKHHLCGRTVTIKFKMHDFTLMTRSSSASIFMNEKDPICQQVVQMLHTIDLNGKKIRLLGVGLSNFKQNDHTEFNMDDRQLKLF
ncbi:DNA polymerase IV [Polluticoccus soli]